MLQGIEQAQAHRHRHAGLEVSCLTSAYIICDGTSHMTLKERYGSNDFKTPSQGVIRGPAILKV